MKRSPIQLVQSTLLKLEIEPLQGDRFERGQYSNPFEYDKITLETARNCEKFPEYWEGEPPYPGLEESTYVVQLGLRTPTDGSDVGPYRFEVVYAGVIAVLPSREVKNTTNDDIALQFGLTLLYGLIREQISNLTHRMMWGQAMLPTMNFLDEKHERPESIQDEVLSSQALLGTGGTTDS